MIRVIFLSALLVAASFKVEAKTRPQKARATAINFIEADWDNALKAAEESKKLVFVDIYATWCGPCKMLKKNTFTDETVADFFNANFVNVSIDGEKGAGPQLLQQYQVEAYPTLIITDDRRNPVLYTMGYFKAKTLMQFAKAALNKKSK